MLVPHHCNCAIFGAEGNEKTLISGLQNGMPNSIRIDSSLRIAFHSCQAHCLTVCLNILGTAVIGFGDMSGIMLINTTQDKYPLRGEKITESNCIVIVTTIKCILV